MQTNIKKLHIASRAAQKSHTSTPALLISLTYIYQPPLPPYLPPARHPPLPALPPYGHSTETDHRTAPLALVRASLRIFHFSLPPWDLKNPVPRPQMTLHIHSRSPMKRQDHLRLLVLSQIRAGKYILINE